ncbi:FtsK/SpoIIIE domain-containing protein [Actinomadura sp. 9N407]|uniref:FtsK/SpoIIIE domain-containing protein n=1 Tax=Actinomadura sp. 9N407 TaxID=3375154 RepID=UPI0037B07F10
MNQETGRPRTDDLEAALASVSTAARLGALLLELRHRAGRSMRELEAGSGLPGRAISDLLTGRRFPDEAGLAAFLRACGVPDGRFGAWLAVAARYGAGPADRPGADPADLYGTVLADPHGTGSTRELTLPLAGMDIDPDATLSDGTAVFRGRLETVIAQARKEILAEVRTELLADVRAELLVQVRDELLAEVREQAAAILADAERQARALLDEAIERAGKAAYRSGLNALHGERGPVSLTGLLGIPDPRDLDPQRIWAAGRRTVPIGLDEEGRPVELVPYEHGLIAGAAGSGAPELLRAIVLGLALARPPEALTILSLAHTSLATFAGMEALPQVAAHLSFSGDAARSEHADRMYEALSGELARRREVSRASGDGASPPLPALLVAVDDLSALIADRPDFGELFELIGRTGAALGVHLLAATERYDETRLRGLAPHLDYRIVLRTSSEAESRALLDGPDAYALSHESGQAFIRRSGEPAAWFRTAQAPDDLVGVVASRMAGHGTAPFRIWTPPLDGTPSLEELLPEPPEEHGRLRAIAGLIDRPFDHRLETYALDLSGDAGHVAVVGGPRTGKTTAIRTLVTSLALTHGPGEVRFHCVDLGGGGLADLDGLPHVDGVMTGFDAERLRRTVEEVHALLERRERRSAERRPAGGRGSWDDQGDVFLVVDGWWTLFRDFEPIAEAVGELAARGLPYGVHVIASSARWGDFGEEVRRLFGSRLELRLPDPNESETGAERAMTVPLDRPGRGLTGDGFHFRTAVADVGAGTDAPSGTAIPISMDRQVYVDFADDPHFLVLGDAGSGRSGVLRHVVAGITERYPPERARIVFIDFERSLLEVAGTEHRIGFAATVSAAAALVNDICASMRKRLDASGAETSWTGAELFLIVDDYEKLAVRDGPLRPLAGLLPHARKIGLHLVVASAAGTAADDAVTAIRPCLLMSAEEGRLPAGLPPQKLPPGRGRHIDRDGRVRPLRIPPRPS